MSISVTKSSWLLMLLASLALIQGCDQKAKQTQTQTLAPPVVDTPPPKPATVSTADLPPPVVGNPEPDQSAANTPPAKPDTTQKKPAHHPKKPAQTTTNQAQPTQVAANGSGAAPSVSAIGELSSGDAGNLRSQTEELINNTEKGVNSINRTLNDSETKTVAQIHEFLKQAREAFNTGDIDGASTLAKKAKVLLTELNPQ
jgi:hypothetical protein